MNQKRIILLEPFSYLPPRRQIIARELIEKGYEIWIVRWLRNACTKELSNQNTYDIHISSKFGSALNIIKYPLLAYRQICAISRLNPNYLIAGHMIFVPVALFWKWFFRKTDTKIIYDRLELFPMKLSLYFLSYRDVFKRIFEKIEYLLMRKCDGILSIDSSDGSFFKNIQRLNSIVLINTPSIKDDADELTLSTIRKKWKDRKVIIYAGGLRKEKGIIVCLDAAAKLKRHVPNILLVLIGPENNLTIPIAEEIKKRNIENYVEFYDFMPYKELQAYLQAADIGLAPYQPHPLYDNVPTENSRKILSYMQASLPIIGPNYGSLGEKIRDENCGVLLDTSSSSILANGIVSILNNKRKKKLYQQYSRSAFVTKYSWESQKKIFDKFWEKIDISFQSHTASLNDTN